MKVKINTAKLSNNCCKIRNDYYDIPTIIQFCKEKEFKEFDYPLVAVDLSIEYSISSFKEMIEEVNRVNNVDLSYPIILSDEGAIIDGYHRIMKAILEGKETIRAIRMEEMPYPSHISK